MTVLANTGGLVETGYAFAGWNTAADGTGTGYSASGSATFAMPATNVVLYAQWTANPCAAGSYNSATGHTPCTPAPAGSYDAGTGNASPTPCPAGTYSPTRGASSCPDDVVITVNVSGTETVGSAPSFSQRVTPRGALPSPARSPAPRPGVWPWGV